MAIRRRDHEGLERAGTILTTLFEAGVCVDKQTKVAFARTTIHFQRESMWSIKPCDMMCMCV